MKAKIEVRLDVDLLQKLDDYCKERGLSRSAVMRLALFKLLREREVLIKT